MEEEQELTIGSIAQQYPRALEEPDAYRFVVETTEPEDGGWVDNLCLRPNQDPDTVGYFNVVGVGVSRETGEQVIVSGNAPLNGFERVHPDVNHSG